jgi:hypothetical protein
MWVYARSKAGGRRDDVDSRRSRGRDWREMGEEPRGRSFSAPHAAAVLVAWALLVCATSARAQSDSALPDPDAFQVHGFMSQGFIKTSNNNYLSESQRGAFDFTEIGLNLTKPLFEHMSVGVQAFARDLGPSGSFIPQINWAYLDYRFRDWLGVRAGRTKIPFGLYNEGSEADSARVPILLPQSIYPIDNEDYLLAQTGGEIYGDVQLGTAGEIEYRAYGGTLQASTPAAAPGLTVANLNVPYVFGGRVMWSPPIDGFRVGASYQSLRFDWDYDVASSLAMPLQMAGLLPANLDGTVPTQFYVKLYVASAEYEFGDLLLSAEYSRWIGDIDSSAPKLVSAHAVNERYYAMVSYRAARWFTPGAYYSVYLPDVHQTSGRENVQYDVAVTARYDITSHWLVKVEGHFMDGTAALDSSLNGGWSLKTLTRDWGVFLFKTTAYF